MKAALKFLLWIAVLGGLSAAAYKPALEYWKERNRIEWETAEVIRGDIMRSVSTTGNIQPLLKATVGSFVSGPIVELNADFNDEVKKGDLLAKVDPRLFVANFQQAQAALETRKAELDRVEAQLQQAINDLKRGQRLQETNPDFLSNREMDALVFNVRSLQAQRRLAKAGIQEATANMQNAKTNLDFTEITAPVDGIVIDRKIDPGQTLASQFQAPELFVVAPDLRKKVHVFASVDEAYIGLIQKAKDEGRPVEFTVEAHPEDLFTGEIEQIRVIGSTEQTVVTYKVVIGAANDEMKLLPDMTATITFEVDSKQDVVKIPNEALRFIPIDPQQVRPQDRKLLDSSRWESPGLFDDDAVGNQNQQSQDLTAADKTKAHRDSIKRHVWMLDGDFLKAVEISTGLSDVRYAEVTSGNLKPGDRLVIGKKSK